MICKGREALQVACLRSARTGARFAPVVRPGRNDTGVEDALAWGLPWVPDGWQFDHEQERSYVDHRDVF